MYSFPYIYFCDCFDIYSACQTKECSSVDKISKDINVSLSSTRKSVINSESFVELSPILLLYLVWVYYMFITSYVYHALCNGEALHGTVCCIGAPGSCIPGCL